VVKIRAKLLLLGIVALIFTMSIAYAADSQLLISNVDVKVGSKTLKNLTDGQTISEEARPGLTVEVRVEVSNNFTRTQDLNIEDITIEVDIEDIDDGDNLEQESRNFDLRADSESKFSFKFEVPLEVREDTYNIIITAEGNDEDGTRHFDEVKLKLEVDKENHNIIVIQKSLTPSDVSCKRENVQLSTTLLNIGTNDEDKVTFQISNYQLGINIEDVFGGLRALPNEPESRFSKAYSFDVPDDADPGNYPLTLKVIYDDDRKVTSDSVNLVVSDCAKPLPEITVKDKEEGIEEEVELIIPKVITQPAAQQPTIPAGATLTLESPLRSTLFVVGVIAAEVIIVIIAIALVVSLFRRRSQS